MKLRIDNEILKRFPELNIGVVVAKGIDNEGTDEEIMNLIGDRESEIREEFDVGTLSQNPRIASWRNAYSSFGAKPKKYRSSVENLHRMILNGIQLRHINKVVDAYNYISIKHTVPVGGDDIDRVDGDITLRLAKGDESFTELNTEETKSPREGEVIYSDDKEVLCRRWNWRECDKSKMTEDTKNIALVVEGMPPITEDELGNITTELGELVQKSCGGSVTHYILNIKNPEAEI